MARREETAGYKISMHTEYMAGEAVRCGWGLRIPTMPPLLFGRCSHSAGEGAADGGG